MIDAQQVKKAGRRKAGTWGRPRRSNKTAAAKGVRVAMARGDFDGGADYRTRNEGD